MYCLIIFLLLHINTITASPCERLHGNFNMKSMSGKWHMVAVIPSELHPDVECFSTGTVETDQTKLRGLNKTSNDTPKTSSDTIKATVVRQRYYSERLFDLLARSVTGISGCFQNAISLDVSNPEYMLVNDIFSDKIVPKDETLNQLHLIELSDGSEPFLIHILWKNPAYVLIYRKSQEVTQKQLKPVIEYINKLHGPQLPPKLCQNTFQDDQALILD